MMLQAVQSLDARARELCKGCIGCVCPGEKGVKVGTFVTLSVVLYPPILLSQLTRYVLATGQ